jgi:hypothetical protein
MCTPEELDAAGVKRRVTRRLDRRQFLKCGAAINHFSILRCFPHALDLVQINLA